MQIHQVKGRYVNSYVVEDTNGLLVVDVAWRGEKYVLGYVCEVLRREPADVKLVVCTHGHPDHSGGIVNVARTCQAQLGVPYATQSLLLRLVNDPAGILFRFTTSIREGFRRRAWNMYVNRERDARARTLPSRRPDPTDHDDGFDGKPDFRLKNNAALPGFEDWRVIHTPGHSWDSCCYFHTPTRTLISGDTLLGSTRKGLLVSPSIYSNPRQMRRTITRLHTLHPASVYPGHGRSFQGPNLLDHLCEQGG